MYSIVIYKLVVGVPTEVRRIDGFKTKEEGLQRLRNIGHTWDYSMENWGHLIREDGKVVGQLNIFRHTYGVVDREVTP